MTNEEELAALEEGVRRLKIEYDIYFGGGSKRPPTDSEWRVKFLVKKLSENTQLNYSQRFRYNAIVQKYAIFSDLWRQKLKIKEEGFRRPQDAMLGIQGMRSEAISELEKSTPTGIIINSDDDQQVENLFETLVSARQNAGLPQMGTLESFRGFVALKTADIRKTYGCPAVEYTVDIQDGRVRLKAKPKK